jgi:hypothetical protein
MGGNSTPPTTVQRTTTNTEPPAFQKPYIERGYETAQQLFETPRSFYEGSTVVPFADQTVAGMNLMENRARAGSPLVTAAQNLTADTMAGNYLNPDSNPYLSNAMDAATRPMREAFTQDTMPAIDAAFSRAGRYGSGLQGNMQARASEDYLQALGDVGNRLAYSNYGDERGRQIAASTAAPAMAELDYSDPARLLGLGASYEDMAARQLQEDVDRQRFGEEEARIRLSEYMPLITGGSFNTRTTDQPVYQGDDTARYLGYGAAGTSIASNLFGSSGGAGTSAYAGLKNLFT